MMRVIFTCLQIWHFKKHRVWIFIFHFVRIGSRNFLEVKQKPTTTTTTAARKRERIKNCSV